MVLRSHLVQENDNDIDDECCIENHCSNSSFNSQNTNIFTNIPWNITATTRKFAFCTSSTRLCSNANCKSATGNIRARLATGAVRNKKNKNLYRKQKKMTKPLRQYIYKVTS
eukprot:552102_1